MLIAIWNMGTNGTFYQDPGGDYFARLKPRKSPNPRHPHPNPSLTPHSRQHLLTGTKMEPALASPKSPDLMNLRVRGMF